jgi:MFS family permease
MVQSFGLIGVVFLLVLFLQIVLGFSALKAGLTLLPLPLAIIFVAPFAGRFTDKIGGRWILFIGTLVTALGIYLMSGLSGVSDWTNLVLPLAVCGIGMGLVMAPTTTVVMESTPVQQSGMGAGILSTTRQIGAVLGLSTLGAVLQNQLFTNISQALVKIPEISEGIRQQIIAGVQSGGFNSGIINFDGNIPKALQVQLVNLFKDQFAYSLDNTMKVGIIVIILGTVASLFISSHIRHKEKTENKPSES